MTVHLAAEAAVATAPPEWTRVRFKRIARVVEASNSAGDLPALSLGSTGDVYPRTADVDRQVASVQTVLRGWRVSAGNLVVNPMWLVGGSIGVSVRCGTVSPDYRVYALDSRVEPRFLHYLLRSLPYREQYRLSARANTTFDRRIPRWDFETMPLALPPRSLQRRIAGRLDHEVSRLSALTETKLRLSKLVTELRLSIIASVVPGDHANERALGAVARLRRGYDLPDQNRTNGTIPVISSAGVSGTHSEAAVAGPGVVTGRYGTLGVVTYAESDYWPLNTTLYVEDFRGNHPRWVYYALQSLPWMIDADKSAVPGVNRNVIHKLRVQVPDVDEQMRIAELLDAETQKIDTLSAQLVRQLALLAEHREALITAAVTGQLDVTRDAPSPPEEALEPA